MIIAESGVFNLFKTILILTGCFVLLRFIGQLMRAKNDLAEEKRLVALEKELLKERNQKLKTFGKVSVSKAKPKGAIQDIDYEEVID
jgi:Na+/phosphate symporter